MSKGIVLQRFRKTARKGAALLSNLLSTSFINLDMVESFGNDSEAPVLTWRMGRIFTGGLPVKPLSEAISAQWISPTLAIPLVGTLLSSYFRPLGTRF
jgi:hypothetical protein